jgi:hypothetical protein
MIRSSAFKQARIFGDLHIPDNVNTLDMECFNSSTFNGTLRLPLSLQKIQQAAFAHCSSLTGDLLVQQIYQSAFLGCSSLDGNLTLPVNCTTISDKAFSGCTLLAIEASSAFLKVTLIGVEAFFNCNRLCGGLVLSARLTFLFEEAFNLTAIANVTFLGLGNIVRSKNPIFPSTITSVTVPADYRDDSFGMYPVVRLPGPSRKKGLTVTAIVFIVIGSFAVLTLFEGFLIYRHKAPRNVESLSTGKLLKDHQALYSYK